MRDAVCINRAVETDHHIQTEEKTRNGKLRTLSRHGELAGARAKRPELVRSKRIVGPVIVAGEIDVLPAEWREMHRESYPYPCG